MPLYDPDNPPSAEHLFSPARGAKPKAPQRIGVVRALDEGDLDAVLNSGPLAPQAQRLTQIKQTHHSLARHLAKGTSDIDCSMLTGYSPAYISTIKKDPLFAELLDYYSKQVEIIHVDALERMRALGIDTLEELQRQLAEEPEKFTIREKMELVELCLVKPAKAPASGAAGNSGPQAITIKFASAPQAIEAGPLSSGKLIDHDPEA